MTIEFNDFTQGLGLDRYPFSVFTAEEEREFLRVAFVRPIAYSPAIQAAREGKNIFLYGERGTGKTALLFELVSERSKTAKVAQVSNFSDLPLVPGRADIYGLYVSTLTDLLFKKLLPQMSNVVFDRPKLDRDDKVLVSYLLKNHTSTLSRAALREDLRKIQHGRFKRGAALVFNFFRGVANQAANTGVDIASHTIRQSLGLPDPSENEASSAKDYFERIELAVDSDFDDGKANTLLLKKTVELCHKLGVKPITLVLDRIDEDSRLKNDSAVIANFLRPFLVENEIFYGNDLQFIFFLSGASRSRTLNRISGRISSVLNKFIGVTTNSSMFSTRGSNFIPTIRSLLTASSSEIQRSSRTTCYHLRTPIPAICGSS